MENLYKGSEENIIEIVPRRAKLAPGESPATAALRELSDMGLIESSDNDTGLKIPLSVRAFYSKNFNGGSNIQRIWNGGTDGESPDSWFHPYDIRWGQKLQVPGMSYWFVRSDCLTDVPPPDELSGQSVRFKVPYKNALVLLLEGSV